MRRLLPRPAFSSRATGALSVVACLLAAGCAKTPEAELRDRAADALGGRRAIERVQSLLIEADGEAYYLGENKRPGSDLPVFQTKFRQAFDWTNRRFRSEQLRLPLFLTGNPSLRRLVSALDNDLAFDVGADDKAVPLPELRARERRRELLHHPVGLLRASYASGAQLQNRRRESNREAIDIVTADGDKLTLVVDPATGFPARITSLQDHPNLGDVVLETIFADYRETNGVRLPARETVSLGGTVIAQFHATSTTVNFETDKPLPAPTYAAFTPSAHLEAPATLRASPGQPPVPTVTAEEIAGGVWYFTGGTHHSVLVEFADHLTLIEAPLDEARTRVVLAKARELRPSKPLTELIVSHHHFDHSGGLRAAVAEGLTVVAADGLQGRSEAASAATAARTQPTIDTASFYGEMISRPHTLAPDALAKAPARLKLITVAALHIVTDGRRRLELYPIAGSPYADTLLMAYLPAERLLVEADVYTPPDPAVRRMPAFPFAKNLVENIEARHLNVERVVPLHGRVVGYQELLTAAQAPSPPVP